MSKLIIIPIFALILVLIDLYIFEGLKTAIQNLPHKAQVIIRNGYWTITAISIIGLFLYHFANPDNLVKLSKTFIMVFLFTNYLSKTLWLTLLVIEDIGRIAYLGFLKIKELLIKPDAATLSSGTTIPRSEFLAKTGLLIAVIPVVGVSWGILGGAHDYRIRRRTLKLPNLPASMDGLRIAQISDIHSGSFWNRSAVKRGVELVNREKVDLIFFTGDLVNNRAKEMSDYLEVFGKISAPMGVYSIFGNHDYGDYVYWANASEKAQNLADLKQVHKSMGWDLLLNEHRLLDINGDKLAVLGIENWSAKARFPKHGDLAKALQGTNEAAVKLLLSHDPSHWRAQVLPEHPDIDVTFSGHTHGMQFGVEIGSFRWSPVKYMYEEWADLYQENSQYLYVNRGFGYLGFPGRIGIPPEITIFELSRSA